MSRRNRTMHLDGPAEGESFMRREGVSVDATPDDEPEWLDNEKGFGDSDVEEPPAEDELDIEDDEDEDEDDDDWDDEDEDDEEE